MNVKEILWNLRIESLTPMQEKAADAFRKGHDVVLLSPTGSGKTLAYLVPLAQSLQPGDSPEVVIMVPTRELALQIESVFKSMSTGIHAMSCYGGRPAMEEYAKMRSLRPQVIVGTPGRMNDHLGKGHIDVSRIRKLVIDEFDKCFEMGFQDEMAQVVSQLPRLDQRFLLSATDSPAIPAFVSSAHFEKLDFLEATDLHERVRVQVVKSPEKDKLNTLFGLLCNLGESRSLVFVNYRESVERVHKFLRGKGVASEMFHGGLEQKDRERALFKFSNGSCNVFVSTDLASRGLDIPDVDNIIHYHLPVDEEAYVHRNGRTARWDALGRALIVLGPEETLPEFVGTSPEDYVWGKNVSRPSSPQWATLYIGKGKKDKVNKVDIVGFLTKVGGLGKDDIGRIDVRERYSFVAVAQRRLKSALAAVRGQKIKGVRTIIEEIR